MLLHNIHQTQTTKTKIVSSIETAEFTKLYENVHRSINIALANESKMLADKTGWGILDL